MNGTALAIIPVQSLNWREDFLDQRQRDELNLARYYAERPHGTDGHIRLLLIDRLSGLVDRFFGGDAPAGTIAEVWSAFRAYAKGRGRSHHTLRLFDDESGRVLNQNEEYIFLFSDFADAITKLKKATNE